MMQREWLGNKLCPHGLIRLDCPQCPPLRTPKPVPSRWCQHGLLRAVCPLCKRRR